jgi:hypothetical protein
MKYGLLIYGDPAARIENAPVPPGVAASWLDYTKALRDSGALRGAEQLFETDTATTVRHRGERLLTDGPFAETKEHLLGFYLIDVADLDTALDWAGRMPVTTYGSVEVRAVRSGMAWQAALDD